MNRLNIAVLLAGLLLLPFCTLVPSVVAGVGMLPHEALQGTATTQAKDIESKDVELNMMFFTPSAPNDDQIDYLARRGVDTIAHFGISEVHYVIRGTLLRLEFPGSNLVSPVGEVPVGSVTSYFIGNNPAEWRTGLSDCAVLRYPEIYPGIDLVYRLQDSALKYEFVVAPNADPQLIRLRYSNADCVDVAVEQVTVATDDCQLVDTGLKVFQDDDKHTRVECRFAPCPDDAFRFVLGTYDQSMKLVIDPVVLLYSTFLGGSSEDEGYDIAVENGSIYVTGHANAGFPTANAFDSTWNGNRDCFVTKLTADGQSLVYSTYLGGINNEYSASINVENGYAYITGWTESSDFPTASAYNSTFGGNEDCFVTKIATDGASLVYSTFLGRGVLDRGAGIAVESGFAYVAGYTQSPNFPTANAYDSSYNAGTDCFVAKFAIDGRSLGYSTFLGGSNSDMGYGIVVSDSYAYVTGVTSSTGFPTANAYDSTYNGGASDCFVTKLAANGMSLIYSTFLGGSAIDRGDGIALESDRVYVAGTTTSSNFPVVHAYFAVLEGSYDSFVSEFSENGQSLVYSTYLGGTGTDESSGIALSGGHAYITGRTTSSDFPAVNAYDSTFDGGYAVFVTSFAADGQWLVYSTLLGAPNLWVQTRGITAADGCAYITGTAGMDIFPTVNAYDSTYNGAGDCFVSIFSNTDSDSDGLSDWEEDCLHDTDPFCIDSDRDNFIDSYEVAYGSNPLDPLSYPGMPQSWYDAIYQDLDGNATLIQQVISWLDGNHTAIESLFTFLEGNATLLIQTVNAVDGNSTQLGLLAALVTQDMDALSSLNATHVGDMAQIRAVLDMLGVTVGDSDCDGLDDLDEIALGTNILCIDTDCDNLNDAYEVKIGTDPTDDDSDNDTYYDGAEVLAGTDPLDSLDYPSSITTTTTTTQSSMGIELIIIAGAAGSIGLAMLLVIMKRRTATKSSA